MVLGVSGAIYLLLNFYVAAATHPPMWGVFIGLLPLAGLGLSIAWKSTWRAIALAMWLAAMVLAALNLEFLRGHTAWIYFIQHMGAMCLLGLMFGLTLQSDPAQALCSRIALFALGPKLDAEYLGYTWKVTWVWTLYFIFSALVSMLLFLLCPIEIWSGFANILTPLSVGGLFVIEYLVRLRVLPRRPHFSVRATIEAYRAYTRR